MAEVHYFVKINKEKPFFIFSLRGAETRREKKQNLQG
jgi:hypothetical protein